MSYDGENFTRVAELTDGGAAVVSDKAIYALRIVATSRSDAENQVVIQSLKIK